MRFRTETLLITIAVVTGCGKSSLPEQELTPPGNSPTPKTAAEDRVSQPETAEPGRDAFPLCGFSLKPPEGWAAESTVQPVHFAARWLPVGSPETDVSQFAVNVTPATTKSFDELVAGFKVPAGYRAERTTIDGVPALDVRHPELGLLVGGKNPPMGPIFLTFHHGCVYKIVFLLDSRDEIVAARGVVNSWRWLPPTSAWGELSTVVDADCLGGPWQLPAAAREDLTLRTPQSASYIVYDYAHQQDALVIGAERVTAADRTLDQQAIKYAERVEQATQLNALLSFVAHPKNASVMVSDFLTGEFPSDHGPVLRHSRYAVWQLAPGEFVHLQFVVNDELIRDEADRQAANQTIEAILASCSAAPAANQPPSEVDKPN